MKAIITDRKTNQTTTFDSVISATTRPDYISIYYTDEEGRKDSDVFRYKEVEVKLLQE